ncbi:RING-H2 finger protein ATL70-like [Lactuca sativa]|uniref:RING-type E3 ubiquitin transferase n=1 Tax=Lactuca sativa TaxID=4236 RepID=A0A9R1WH14_LACSA|nr:RING-H2 finger protein ATL70-like [Lactuca sativa]KAJ0222687.1 hypothetical protein LSAT_V11C200089270 [Lactuca sativa]
MYAVEPPYTANSSKAAGTGDYIFMAGFVFCFLLLVTFGYTIYMCRRSQSPTPISTTNDDTHNHHLIRISPGLDDDVLVTFPTFVYSDSEATGVAHKSGTTTDHAKDFGCSICLADYEPAEVVRVLPECRHFFHVKCIDMWLKTHPTCPVCRNSVIALPVQQS